jgi:hypothetical protein
MNTPSALGLLIDCGLPGVVGVYAILVGFRIIGPKPGTNLTYDFRFRKYGYISRAFGAVALLSAVLYGIRHLSR